MVLVAIDFHIMEKNTMEVIGYSQMFGYPHSSKYLLCSEIHTGLVQYEGILDKLFL